MRRLCFFQSTGGLNSTQSYTILHRDKKGEDKAQSIGCPICEPYTNQHSLTNHPLTHLFSLWFPSAAIKQKYRRAAWPLSFQEIKKEQGNNHCTFSSQEYMYYPQVECCPDTLGHKLYGVYC